MSLDCGGVPGWLMPPRVSRFPFPLSSLQEAMLMESQLAAPDGWNSLSGGIWTSKVNSPALNVGGVTQEPDGSRSQAIARDRKMTTGSVASWSLTSIREPPAAKDEGSLLESTQFLIERDRGHGANPSLDVRSKKERPRNRETLAGECYHKPKSTSKHTAAR